MRKLFGLALVTLLLVTGVGGSGFVNAFSPVASFDVALYADQMGIAHHGDRPIASPLLAQQPKTAVATQRVTYGKIGGQPLTGYLATPKTRDRPLPALIVIHEWWGLNDNIEAVTRQLAAEGYTALAVDLYDGKVGKTPDEAKVYVTEALQQIPKLEENIRQAYQYLEKEQKAPKIASIGWCFGGLWSLKTALLFPTQLDAAVIYYGANLETNRDRLKPLQVPILGLFGELDKNPSPATVREFEATLKSLGQSPQIYIFPGADHAFANPSGTRYNAKAAEDAWQKTTAFLARHLQ
jgi:carboxymethylenebutenolidase